MTRTKTEIIAAACQDRRLNLPIELRRKVNKEKGIDETFVVSRTAGPRISKSHEETLVSVLKDEQREIVGVTVWVHNDCGAMGTIYNYCKGGQKDVSPEVFRNFIEPMNGIEMRSRQHLEDEINPALQREYIKNLLKLHGIDLPVKVELIKVEPHVAGPVHSAPKLAILKPSATGYEELLGSEYRNFYVIQTDDVRAVLPDVVLSSEKLGIDDIVLVAEQEQSRRTMQTEVERLNIALATLGTKNKQNVPIRAVLRA